MQKRLMILGAGPGQLPLIRRAVELGLHVVTVDYLPNNVGHQYSHSFVNCSTVDKECVVAHAKRLRIDGIATFASDVATQSVAYTAEQLGLPGSTVEAAKTLSSKTRFRDFQRRLGLRGPRFVSCQSYEEAKKAVDEIGLPAIFKPSRSSGSRGISRVSVRDDQALRFAFEDAYAHCLARTVCVEEHVKGIDVSGDAFLLDGKLLVAITRKHIRGFVTTGHSLPTNITDAQQEMVREEILNTCNAVGLRTGPLDFDARVSDRCATIIEMSPRLGGNGIPALIRRASGVDLIEMTILSAIGEPFEHREDLRIVRSCGSWIFGGEDFGVLASAPARAEILHQVPEVFEFEMHRKVGEAVRPFIHSGDSLGHVLFDYRGEQGYEAIRERLARIVRPKVARAPLERREVS